MWWEEDPIEWEALERGKRRRGEGKGIGEEGGFCGIGERRAGKIRIV